MKNLVRFAVLTIVTAALLVSLLTGRAAVSNLTIGAYQLISSTRATRTEFDYVYQASVTNPGTADFVGVTATLTSKSPKTIVIDGTHLWRGPGRNDRCLHRYIYHPPGP